MVGPKVSVAPMSTTGMERFFEEAQQAGVTVLGAERVEIDQHGSADRAKQLLRLAVVGDAKVIPTHLFEVGLVTAAGPAVHLALFQNGTLIGGYYYFSIPGGLAQPIVRLRRFFGSKWHANDDRAVLARLDGSKELKAAVKELPFARQTTMGSITLDWTVQAWSLGDGSSVAVVQAGSSHFDVHQRLVVGAVRVARALATVMDEPREAQGFYFAPPDYQAAIGRLRSLGASARSA